MAGESSSKKPIREKVAIIYENLFEGGSLENRDKVFWNELFLLKPKFNLLEEHFKNADFQRLSRIQDSMNVLVQRCVEYLKDDNPIRIANAMMTLMGLIRGVYTKDPKDCGCEPISIIMDPKVIDRRMQSLIENVNELLINDHIRPVKSLALKLLLSMVSSSPDLGESPLAEYLMTYSVFEPISLILSLPALRHAHGHDAVLLLTLLVQYRKYQFPNPYTANLSILDDELALNGYAEVVCSALREYNLKQGGQNSTDGWLYSLTNWVGQMFINEESPSKQIKADQTVLLALYEAVHLNRNFMTALTHSSSEAPSPVEKSVDAPADPASQSVVRVEPDPPANLIVTFLEYCSIILQNFTGDSSCEENARLCLLILTCIAEDQYANSLMHDVNMNFSVTIYRAPMRHRSKDMERMPSRPLACAILDLTVEFLVSHMMKSFPEYHYLKCLGIIHRILCYQKKFRKRLTYSWPQLWSALIGLLKFLIQTETVLLPKVNTFHLCSKVLMLINLFVTYGDNFLPTPNAYDQLYYELVRMGYVFDNLYSLALRYTTVESEFHSAAASLTNDLVNVRAIVNHFSPKIDSWSAVNHLSSLTEDQVLEVVRSNYDTLTLKLQENLDQYQRFCEQPKECEFFMKLVKKIVFDSHRQQILTADEQLRIVQSIIHS